MRESTHKIKSLFVWLVLALVFFTLPMVAYASVVLENVDARQAYVDTFYGKTVAQLIYDEANQHNINPRLILVMLQRESSAITQSTPSSTTRQAWPLFYNYDERMADCLNGDESSCADTKYNHLTYRERAYDYGGVGQQIAYATAQLRNLQTNSSYCGGSLVVSVDGGNLTADNAATCALYKYTPHAVSYNTDSAFYTNWVAWWGGGTPNGGAYSATNTISDANFNYIDMSASDINAFLVGKGSWLANNTIAEYLSVPYPVIYVAPPPTPAPPPAKTGDANGDNAVDLLDLSILAAQWGGGGSGDLNSDGVVDLLDLSILAANWGS